MQLKANKINFKYNEDRYVLKDIDFYVNSGEVVGLVAPSGFGKTSTAGNGCAPSTTKPSIPAVPVNTTASISVSRA